MPTNNAINSQDPIQVAKGGTGQSTLTTANGILAAGTSATGAIQNIGTGSAGQVLTSNGTSLPSFQAAPSGAMVLLHTITFNNTATNYDLTSYVTGYDTYKFIGSAVTNATGVNPLIGLQFSTNGGSTWLNTGYVTWYQYFGSGGSAGSNVYTDNVPILFLNQTANYLNSCEAIMTGYGGSSGAVVQSFMMTSANTNAFPQVSGGHYYGSTLNGVRITNPAGTNFIAGKFSIYGIAT